MIPREVMLQTLGFQQPGVCPYYIWVDDAMVPPLAQKYGEDQFIGSAGSTRTFAGSFTAMTEVVARPLEEQGECYVDDYGVTYRRGSTLHVEKPALDRPSLSGYVFPDLTTDEHFAGLDAWFETHRERFTVVQMGMLFFERTWGMRGMENILMDLHTEPQFVHDLLAGLESVCMRLIDRLLSEFGDRIDAVGMSEDYGSQKSLLIHPEQWREFIKPHLSRFAERIHAGGKRFYLHSCGHIRPIIGDLVEAGVDMLQPLQPEAMDIFEIKEKFGRDLCLMGGISTQHTLLHGTPHDIRREVRDCLDRMATGGGYVMAPAKPILPGIPLENAVALIDAFVDQ